MIKSPEELKKVVSVNNQKYGRSGSWINRFRALRAMQKKAQDFYDMNYQFKMQEGYKALKLPSARRKVDTFLSHLPLTNPVVEVLPFKLTAPIVKKAIKQQEFYQALLRHSLSQSEPALFSAAKDIGLRGEAFWKIVYDQDVIGGLPKINENEDATAFKERKLEYLIHRMPLLLTAPDPTNCYPGPQDIDCRPVEMVEVYPAYVRDIKAVWTDWKTTKKDDEIVVFIEYHNDDKRCFLADGTVVTEGMEDNPYKKTPYIHVYSGWGHRTGDNKPEDQAVNLIFESQNSIVEQSRFRAYLDMALGFAALPLVHTEKEQEDYGEGGLKVKPGMVLYGGEKVDIGWAAANLPAGILQAIGLSEAEIGKEAPGVLTGEVPKGVEAGYPMALMIGQARLKFGYPLENLKTLVARSLELVHCIIRDVAKEDLALWGENQAVTLSAEDCKGTYQIKVDFDASTPEARANRALVGQKLRQGGSISQYTELKDWQGNKNPNKEINRMIAESIMEHPTLQREAAVEAIRAIKGDQAAMRVEQAMAEGEAGAQRKARSSGIDQGGERESEVPEDVIAQAMSKRGKATRAEPTEAT